MWRAAFVSAGSEIWDRVRKRKRKHSIRLESISGEMPYSCAAVSDPVKNYGRMDCKEGSRVSGLGFRVSGFGFRYPVLLMSGKAIRAFAVSRKECGDC